MSGARWIAETLHEELGLRSAYRAGRVLVEERTEHQHLVLFENEAFGRVLMLDGAVQLTTRDEFVYHEMMAHVPLLAHGGARRVLIVGGGDGGIAREVLKHGYVESVTLVEIDAGVIEFAKAHLHEVASGAFEDPRLDLVIADGAAFVAGMPERYDVVLVDSTDPVGPARVLFTPGFYSDCRRALTPGGILVTQSGSPFFQPGVLEGSVKGFLQAGFADARCYLAATPSYVGGFFALGFASDDERLARIDEAELRRRLDASGVGALDYYAPSVHRGAFSLPPYVERIVARARAAAQPDRGP